MADPERGRNERAATALLVVGATGVVAGALLPWDLPAAFYTDGDPTSGVALGPGVLTAGTAVGLVALRTVRDWSRPLALGTIGVGIVFVGGAMGAIAAGNLRGAGVALTVLAGLVVVLAGSLSLASTVDRSLPRPPAGVGPSTRVWSGLAAGGIGLVVTGVAGVYLRNPHPPSPGSGVWIVLVFVAVAGAGGCLLAWSRIIGGFAVLCGTLLFVAVAPVYSGTSVLLWAPGESAFGGDPLVVVPVGLGAVALLTAGLLELGGAGAPVARVPGR